MVNSSLSTWDHDDAPSGDGASVVVEFHLGVQTEVRTLVVIRGEGLLPTIGGVNVLDQFATEADLAITRPTALPRYRRRLDDVPDRRQHRGPASVTGATVTDTFPASLICTYPVWELVAARAPRRAAEHQRQTVNLPIGGSVTTRPAAQSRPEPPAR